MPIRSPLGDLCAGARPRSCLPVPHAASAGSVDAGGSAATTGRSPTLEWSRSRSTASTPTRSTTSADGARPTIHRLLRRGGRHPQRPHRGRADHHPAQPHRDDDQPSGRREPRRPRCDVEQRPAQRPTSSVPPGIRSSSVFSVVHDDGGSTALFSTKAKFGLFQRSWPHAIDRFAVEEQPAGPGAAVATATWSHAGVPSPSCTSRCPTGGHAHGGMTPRYLAAVRRTDRLLGGLVRTIARTRGCAATPW